MLEPEGPLPREIYIRRRIAALVLVAVVVLAIIITLVMVSREKKGSSAPQAAGETTTAAPADSKNPAEESTTTAATSTKKTGEKQDPASRGRCSDDSIEVAVRPAAPNYEAGGKALFYAEISNTGDTTCDRDLAGAPLSFEIYRLEDNSRVWASTDCTRLDGEDKVDLVPGKPVLRQIEWSGRVSQPGACSEQDRVPAEPGAYQVYALVGEKFSPAGTFNLTAPSE